MNKKEWFFRAILAITFVFVVYIMGISNNDKKGTKQYVVVTKEGDNRIVQSINMSPSEASLLKLNKNIIIEEDGYVTGSTKKLNKKIKKEKKNKKENKKSFDEMNPQWNLKTVNVIKDESPKGQKVKVAIIDSGIDYTSDIDVYLRKNFIPGENEISILYEDICGHGTSVAGIIAAKENNEGITGINPNVELYSARVLDSDLKAPISRVVEAIYWAIENKVNIINISFGTQTDSKALEVAIEDAYNAGILIIAAAGNNGMVEYPAAYDEVIAVGSVDSMGNCSKGSAKGKELELMAPGEKIISTGAFGGVIASDGTSMAAPHVTGIASLLWQKDLSLPSELIRSLLDFSANKYGNDDEYGYGLVDLEFALNNYEWFKNNYVKDDLLSERIVVALESGVLTENREEVIVYEDIPYVTGSWYPDDHQLLAGADSSESGTPLSPQGLAVVKLGAIANDTYLSENKVGILEAWITYPQWHGYTSKWSVKLDKNSIVADTFQYANNYVEAYLYISTAATGFDYNNISGTSNKYNPPAQSNYYRTALNSYADISSIISASGIKRLNGTSYSWSTLMPSTSLTDRNKSLFIYGMALHTVTDLFAHATTAPESKGTLINHPNADKKDVISNRYECAKVMAGIVVSHIKRGEPGQITDFYYALAKYDDTFYIPTYSSKIKESDNNCYTNPTYKEKFDKISGN